MAKLKITFFFIIQQFGALFSIYLAISNLPKLGPLMLFGGIAFALAYPTSKFLNKKHNPHAKITSIIVGVVLVTGLLLMGIY